MRILTGHGQPFSHRAIARAFLAAAVLRAATPSPVHAQQAVAPPRWHGTLDLTIGGEDATDDASFGSISGLAVDGAGRVYVADRQDSQIKIFSTRGALVSRIGRAGSGPAEFRQLATIVVAADGLLWVRDEGNARMQALRVAKMPATNVRTVPLRRMTGGSMSPITFAGRAIVDETIYKDKRDDFRPIRTRIAMSGAVEREDTLRVPAGADAGVKRIKRDEKNASGEVIGFSESTLYQPFGSQWLRAYGPNGMRADAVSSAYEVRIYDGAETLVRTLRRAVPPVPLSPRERALGEERLDALAQEAKLTRGALGFGVPATKPILGALMWTQDGQLWVERAVRDGTPPEADVYDASGTWIAIAEWPQTIDFWRQRAVITGKTLHSVATDSSDVEQVVRLRFR